MATIDLMDRFGNLGEGGIRNNGTLDSEAMFQPALRTMRTDFIQVKAGDSIVYKNMSGMSSIWNILSFYTGDAQGLYVSGISGQTTPQSGVWTAQQDGYVRLFGSFPAGDNISVTMTDLAPDVDDYLAKYNAMNYRFLPNSIPKIVAHIQEYLSNHPIADSTTLQSIIDSAFQSYMEEIHETADTYISEAIPPVAAAAVDAAASPALQEITAKAAEAAESARQAGLSQQSAEMSEENALTYRNQAQQIKDSITAEVAASVQAAQEQATLAQESAQAADESADTAELFVGQARAQAEAASAQAQTASGYASDAQGYMQDASGFADNASDYADAAAQSAATFTTDPTLTISGKAADAKATGDELSALKSAFGAFYKNNEVFATEVAYTASTELSNVVVYHGLIPAGVAYMVECVTTGGVSRIDISRDGSTLYRTPSSNRVTVSETRDVDVREIKVKIPADKVSQNGTLSVTVTVANPIDTKIDNANALIDENADNIATNASNIAKLDTNVALAKSGISEFEIKRSVTSGGFDEQGNIITSPLYYRTTYTTTFAENSIKIRVLKPGINAKLYCYSSSTLSQSTFLSASDWITDETTITLPERSASRKTIYLTLMVGNVDGTNISYEKANGSAVYVATGNLERLPIVSYTANTATNNGTAYYNANYHISTLYEVTPGEVLKTANVFAMAFFSNLNDHVSTLNGESIIVPSGAKYARVIVKKDYIAAFGSEEELQNIYFIDANRVKSDSGETSVPQVYFENDYLPNKIKTIQANTNVERGMSFAFVTDMHVNDNSLVSGVLLEYVLGRSTVPFIICGGDIPTAYSTEYGVEEAECETEARRWIEYAQRFGWNRFFACRGNHDFMKPSPEASVQKIYYVAPEYKTYNYISRNNEHIVKRFPPHNYYYIDNISERMRIIVLDEYENGQYGTVETLTQTQVDWLLGDALNVENYKILIVSHEPFDTVWAHPDLTFAPIQALMKAIKNKTTINYTSGVNIVADYRETTLELIGHLCGHTHLDNYNVDDGVLTITTTCDAFYKKYEHNRVEGAITEPAFDIISIDTQNKIIKMCRIGEGADRKIVYDGENVYTITQNLSNCFTCYQTTENVYGGSDWTNFYHADSGYTIDNANVSITMGGVDIKNTVWNQNSKRIYIPNITGNVVITISAT